MYDTIAVGSVSSLFSTSSKPAGGIKYFLPRMAHISLEYRTMCNNCNSDGATTLEQGTVCPGITLRRNSNNSRAIIIRTTNGSASSMDANAGMLGICSSRSFFRFFIDGCSGTISMSIPLAGRFKPEVLVEPFILSIPERFSIVEDDMKLRFAISF